VEQAEVQEHRGEQPVVLAVGDAVQLHRLAVGGVPEHRAPVGQRRRSAQQPAQAAAEGRVAAPVGQDRGHHQDHVDGDERLRDVPLLADAPASEGGTRRPLGP
jgi:hypothetical protein